MAVSRNCRQAETPHGPPSPGEPQNYLNWPFCHRGMYRVGTAAKTWKRDLPEGPPPFFHEGSNHCGSTELRKPRLARRFARVGKTSGLEHAMFYLFSVECGGFGAGRHSCAPPSCCICIVCGCFAKSRNHIIYSVSEPSGVQNLVFFKGLSPNAACGNVWREALYPLGHTSCCVQRLTAECHAWI